MELLVVIGIVVLGYVAWSGLKKEDEVKEDVAPGGPVKGPETGVSKKAPTEKELNRLTKVNLEKLGREYGVELDRRKTKANMIKDFLGHVNLH